MSFYVDISSGGALVGDGPLTSVTSWQITRRMDRAGAFEFTLPATDPNADQLLPRRVAAIYAQLGGATAYTYVGGGYIDRIGRGVAADGTVTLTVAGDDLLRQLANELVTVEQDGGAFAATAFLPSGWTATVTTPPINDLYYSLQYETKLGGLLKVCDRAQTHFYLSGANAITVTHSWTASGVRAVQVTGDVATELAAITALAVETESYDLATRVYPMGSGNSGAALTLLACTETALSGYTLDTAANYIESDAGAATYGTLHRLVQFKDIRPISSTDLDVEFASNMLYWSALYWLAQHEAPTVSYRLALAQCSSLLAPLQTLRLVYRDLDAGIDLDADLYILEATIKGDADGLQTTDVVVATGAWWPEDGTGALVESMQRGSVYQVHPQLNANSYVLPYSKNVDQTETANFRFRFDDEVLQLTRCTFDFQLLALESTVKTVGSSSPTSSASGDHSHDVTIGNHNHSVTISGHTHDVTIGSHTHSVTISDHTHSVSISSHQHEVPLSASADPTGDHPFARIVYYDATDDNLYFQAASGSGYSTSSASGGSSTPTSGSGGGSTPTSGSGGGTTVSSSSGGGTTATSSDGGGTTASSASGGGHTHTVTPTITTTYGIYRDSSSNVFAVTDLEYSLDGSTWYNFSVGVNGYTVLGDGWTRVDLSALLQNSTTLRPTAANNLLRIRRKSTGATGKMATIDAQMNVRTIIQAVALT